MQPFLPQDPQDFVRIVAGNEFRAVGDSLVDSRFVLYGSAGPDPYTRLPVERDDIVRRDLFVHAADTGAVSVGVGVN